MGSLANTRNSTEIHLFQSQLLNWYLEKQRPLPWRESADPYRIWVSEVMLQQTQVNTVLTYYERFINRFPTITELAAAGTEEVLKYWEKMGYYARARNFHRAAKKIVEDFAGKIPADYQTFRSLPGVGDYIAAAVLSLAFAQPFAVVDGNVKRVLARRRLIETPVNLPAAKREFQEIADELLAREQPAIYNQALMELGALICRPQNPLCAICPVQTGCKAFETGRQEEFPVKTKKKSVPHYRMVAGVIIRGTEMLIVKRPDSGLLGGLWEFPNERIQKQELPEPACRRILQEIVGLKVDSCTFLTQVPHAYTHFKITVEVFRCILSEGSVHLHGPADFRWIKRADFDKYPFTGVTHKFLSLLN